VSVHSNLRLLEHTDAVTHETTVHREERSVNDSESQEDLDEN